MKVVYIGMFPEVEIGPTGQTAVKGEAVEVPDNIGKSLIQQEDNWRAVGGEGAVDDTVKGILASVGDDAEKAAVALDAERAGRNRKSLVEALEAITEGA